MKHQLVPLTLALACAATLSAVTIKIDYSLDTANFFDTAEKRAALEAAADLYADLLDDDLLEIDPNTFDSPVPVSWTAIVRHPTTNAEHEIDNLVVPADTIIVFAGARPIPGSTLGTGGPGGFSASGLQSWFDRIRGRGNPGAIATPRTDFAPWGGSVSFDSDASWNFSLEGNGPGREFVSIALHELGHVLGIGTADVWQVLTSTNVFTGPAANQSLGASPDAFNGHLQNPAGGTLESPLFGSFAALHGTERPALMLPSLTDTGSNFDVATDLDLSVLFDLGWEVTPRTSLEATALSPDAAAFTWPSTSFIDYQLERATDLASFDTVVTQTAGDGFAQAAADPAPPAGRAFYRLRSQNNLASATSQSGGGLGAAGGAVGDEPRTIRVDPVIVECQDMHPE